MALAGQFRVKELQASIMLISQSVVPDPKGFLVFIDQAQLQLLRMGCWVLFIGEERSQAQAFVYKVYSLPLGPSLSHTVTLFIEYTLVTDLIHPGFLSSFLVQFHYNSCKGPFFLPFPRTKWDVAALWVKLQKLLCCKVRRPGVVRSNPCDGGSSRRFVPAPADLAV